MDSKVMEKIDGNVSLEEAEATPTSEKSEPSSEPEDEDLDHDLHFYELSEVAKYLDVNTLKASRLVNKEWNEAFSGEFRKKAILVFDFSFEKDVGRFITTFDHSNSNNKLVAESIWIQKPKHLRNKSIMKWLEECGGQITSAGLGLIKPIIEPMDFEEGEISDDTLIAKLFSAELISSFLNQCQNLKSLKILGPFPVIFDVSFDTIAVDTADVAGLEIEAQPNSPGSSVLFPNILKSLKSLKTLKMIKMDMHILKAIGEHNGMLEYYGNEVLEMVTKLNLARVDPWHPHHYHLLDSMNFKHLRKLALALFCKCSQNGGPIIENLLSSVANHLEELVLERCPTHGNMKCFMLEIDRFFAWFGLLPDLKALKILEVATWKGCNSKSMSSLERLLILKDELEEYNTDNQKTFQYIRNENLKKLIFQCGSENAEFFSKIARCYTNLETLEADFYGKDLKPVISALLRESRSIKNLKLYIDTGFDSNYFQELASSEIRKLSFEFRNKTMHCLLWNFSHFENFDCLKSSSLRELHFIGMKFCEEEYQLLLEKLSEVKVNLYLLDCVIERSD